MKTAIELIAEERNNIKKKFGNTTKLVDAAVCYALPDHKRFWYMWPFSRTKWEPTPNDRISELVKAGALIAAEIERLQNEKV